MPSLLAPFSRTTPSKISVIALELITMIMLNKKLAKNKKMTKA